MYKCSDNFLSFETEDEVLCCKIDKFQFFHLPTSQFICWLAYLVLTNGSKMSWNWIWFFKIPILIVFIFHLPLLVLTFHYHYCSVDFWWYKNISITIFVSFQSKIVECKYKYFFRNLHGKNPSIFLVFSLEFLSQTRLCQPPHSLFS